MIKRTLISCCLLLSFSLTSLGQELTTFILVRHAEKAKDDDRNPSLSDVGIARAEKLNKMLSTMEISAIYSTPYKRTRLTVSPIAEAKGLEVTDYDFRNNELLTSLMEKHKGGTILISGHSNTTPVLVNKLLGEEKFAWLKEDEYDKVFIVTLSALGEGKLALLSY